MLLLRVEELLIQQQMLLLWCLLAVAAAVRTHLRVVACWAATDLHTSTATHTRWVQYQQ
jgi:hypothetical protein